MILRKNKKIKTDLASLRGLGLEQEWAPINTSTTTAPNNLFYTTTTNTGTTSNSPWQVNTPFTIGAGTTTIFPNLSVEEWNSLSSSSEHDLVTKPTFEYRDTTYEIDLSNILEGQITSSVYHKLGGFASRRFLMVNGDVGINAYPTKNTGVTKKDIEKMILHAHRIAREKIDELDKKLKSLQYAIDYCNGEHISVALGMGVKEDEI